MTTLHEVSDPTFDERVATEVALAFARAGFANEDGASDKNALADHLYTLVRQAEVTVKGERASLGVTRRALMEHAFPQVAGPEAWAEQHDPDLATAVYKKLDGECWRSTDPRPGGRIQSRLERDGLVICRTKVNPHETDAVYVTRDLGCILEDVIKPQRAEQKKRADRDAASMVMLIERLPEHGARFNRELVGGLKTALQSAQDNVAAALSAADSSDDESTEE